MIKENYEQEIRDLDWQLCTIKASAEINELISLDDDLDGVEDFRCIGLWKSVMDRLHVNDIHTWIVLDKPSFQDLIQHEPHAYILFSALARMNYNAYITCNRVDIF